MLKLLISKLHNKNFFLLFLELLCCCESNLRPKELICKWWFVFMIELAHHISTFRVALVYGAIWRKEGLERGLVKEDFLAQDFSSYFLIHFYLIYYLQRIIDGMENEFYLGQHHFMHFLASTKPGLAVQLFYNADYFSWFFSQLCCQNLLWNCYCAWIFYWSAAAVG